MTRVRCGYSVLSGVSLAVLLAVSQAFVPAATTLARATDGARAVVAGQQQKSLRRGTIGVTMSTRRDVLRMPSSEPMVRQQQSLVFVNTKGALMRYHYQPVVLLLPLYEHLFVGGRVIFLRFYRCRSHWLQSADHNARVPGRGVSLNIKTAGNAFEHS